ncbi:hypothetical protein V5O48_008428 [Marasmius crinis-equi]|uniref:BSD domain-containing protein n=1 Tax=Marasmius crinis-equi TaxID=585013 RepID=A0ABR3FDX0_9AGAR
MNFLDPYDITATTTNTPPPENPNEPSLNEEVTQVITSFNRFWGGFRQQSQAVFETARKDLGQVVTQAQKELTKLTAEAPNEDAGATAAASSSRSPQVDDAQGRSSVETLKPASTSEATSSSSSTSQDDQQTPDTSTSGGGGLTPSALFSRLQSALPPNVVATVQENIPESLKNTDFTQLRTNLTTEFQRIQGVTRTQAEEYVHKSETLLREAMKEAGDVLRDAVKVIPPEEGASSGSGSRVAPVFTWDGSDMWMLPTDSADTTSASGKGKEKVTSNAVATRAEALLKRLKHDPELLKHDPESDQGADGVFLKWVEENVDQDEKGLEGQKWAAKIKAELDESDDGRALQATLDALVPAEISKEVFWKRYFYRVYQIRQEEEKRKALLQGTVESDEDFSWEDEDGDEDASAKDATPTSVTPGETLAPAANPSAKGIAADKPEKGSATPISPQANTPATTSPRHSSEESYDLVSSGNVSASGDGKKKNDKGEPSKADSDDGDSDWE